MKLEKPGSPSSLIPVPSLSTLLLFLSVNFLALSQASGQVPDLTWINIILSSGEVKHCWASKAYRNQNSGLSSSSRILSDSSSYAHFQMLHKSHQCNELDGNMNPSSGVF